MSAQSYICWNCKKVALKSEEKNWFMGRCKECYRIYNCDKARNFYQNHKDDELERSRINYKIKASKSREIGNIKCEICGGHYHLITKSKHNGSKKHQNAILNKTTVDYLNDLYNVLCI